MTIPQLNADGLLPPGRHVATLEEFREAFVVHQRFTSTVGEREHMFVQLRLHRLAVQEIVTIKEHWLGGSLTADRVAAPSDCDALYKLDRNEVNTLKPGAKAILDYLFDETAAHSFFQVHPFLELLPVAVSSSQVIVGDLEILFSQTKDGRPCGNIVVADHD
jgi:hypothetical protein